MAILKQGVAAWNKWREEHPDAKIDLRWAKLDGQNLSGANFHCADIRHASFKKAILVKTDFREIRAGFDLLIKFIKTKRIIGNICKKVELLLSKQNSLIDKYIIDSRFLGRSTKKYCDALMCITFNIYLLIIFIPFLFPYLLVQYKHYLIINEIINIIDNSPKFIIIPASCFSSIMFIFFNFDLYQKTRRSIKTNDSYIDNGIVIGVSCVIFSVCSFYIRKPYIIKKLGFLDGIPEIFAVSSSIGIFFISILLVDILMKIIRMYTNRFMTRETKTMYFCANFTSADLTNAKFDRAKLDHTVFDNAISTGCSWRNSQGLTHIASCNGTILTDHDVCKLLVFGTGKGLFLKGKNMKGACLIDADLCGVDLRETDLRQVNLSGADITGTKLYGSARDNWIIDGIRCDYVYWDKDGKQRKPPDRDFRPGEFEELYKQLPTFEYIFEQGFTPLDPLIMDQVVQAINERHQEFSLKMVNVDIRGQPHVTFTVCHLEHVEKAKQEVTASYEAKKGTPEQRVQLMEDFMELFKKSLENQSKLIDKIPSVEGLKMGDTYNNYGQAAAIGKKATASGNTFQQITADLSRLHEEMQSSAKTPEQRAAAEDVAKAAQSAREQNESAMLQHLKNLKNVGKFALDCAKTIGTDVAAEYLKKAMGM